MISVTSSGDRYCGGDDLGAGGLSAPLAVFSAAPGVLQAAPYGSQVTRSHRPTTSLVIRRAACLTGGRGASGRAGCDSGAVVCEPLDHEDQEHHKLITWARVVTYQ